MDLHVLRKKFIELQDEHAHQAMQTPASDPFQHGIQVGTYRSLGDVIEAITVAMKEQDRD